MKNIGDLTLREFMVEHLAYFDLGFPSSIPIDRYKVDLHEAAHSILHIAFLKGLLRCLPNGNPFSETLIFAIMALSHIALEHGSAPDYSIFERVAKTMVQEHSVTENLKLVLAHCLTPKSLRTRETANAVKEKIFYATGYDERTLFRLASTNGLDIRRNPNPSNDQDDVTSGKQISINQIDWAVAAGENFYHYSRINPRGIKLPSAKTGFTPFTAVPQKVATTIYHEIAQPFAETVCSLQLKEKFPDMDQRVAELVGMKISLLLPGIELPMIDGDLQNTFHMASKKFLGYDIPTRNDKAKTLIDLGLIT